MPVRISPQPVKRQSVQQEHGNADHVKEWQRWRLDLRDDQFELPPLGADHTDPNKQAEPGHQAEAEQPKRHLSARLTTLAYAHTQTNEQQAGEVTTQKVEYARHDQVS